MKPRRKTNSALREKRERRLEEQRGLLQATLWALVMVAVVFAIVLLRLATS